MNKILINFETEIDFFKDLIHIRLPLLSIDKPGSTCNYGLMLIHTFITQTVGLIINLGMEEKLN